MKSTASVILGAALIAGAAMAVAQPMGDRPGPSSGPPSGPRPAPVEPVVVELFTAQGCAACPGANQMVEAIAGEPGVIALTYAVGYWDYLGWADTFARPEFAERQRAYQSAMRLRSVYTPQVVIDGRLQLSGAEAPAVQQAVNEQAAQRTFPPEVEFRESGRHVGVGSGAPPAGGAEVWAIAYRPGPQTVTVKNGDNRGQTVRHVNVVRGLTRLGDWTGRPALYALPAPSAPEDGMVILVQAKTDRAILTAAVR